MDARRITIVHPAPVPMLRSGQEPPTETTWSLGDAVVDSAIAGAAAAVGITDAGARHLQGVKLDSEGAIRAAVFAESTRATGADDDGGRGDKKGRRRKRRSEPSSGESKENGERNGSSGTGGNDLNEDDDEGGFCIPCGVLLCGGAPNVDPDVFRAANNSGLVYDGRLVVDAKFRTSDRSVLAGGTLTKFSRAHGAGLPRHEMYNAREVRHLDVASEHIVLRSAAAA